MPSKGRSACASFPTSDHPSFARFPTARADLLEQAVDISDAGLGVVLFEVTAVGGRPSLLTVRVVEASSSAGDLAR
jgi:hypothetical protein